MEVAEQCPLVLLVKHKCTTLTMAYTNTMIFNFEYKYNLEKTLYTYYIKVKYCENCELAHTCFKFFYI